MKARRVQNASTVRVCQSRSSEVRAERVKPNLQSVLQRTLQRDQYAGFTTESGQSELERAKGIEPSYAAWEAAVLPLNYARAGRH